MSGSFASGRDAIAICDRCHMQFQYPDLIADGDQPGLRVCRDCYDVIDPWKLPQRTPEPVALRNPRPDTPLDPEGLV